MTTPILETPTTRPQKRTKIVCTLGPACESEELMTRMVSEGMNVARLNFSHGTHENHSLLIERIRAVSKKANEPIAIVQDLQGPKIRVGKLPDEGVALVAGETVVFDTGIDLYSGSAVPVDYKELHTRVKKGDRLFLSDGRMEAVVENVEGTRISTTIVTGGILLSHKGLNVPDSDMDVSSLTEKDKEDLRFGVSQGIDYVAVSFVQKPEDILDVKYLIRQYEEELHLTPEAPLKIIAKIERPRAVEHIDAILDVADAIMIARGDLGIEIPAAEVPLVQKRLIEKAMAKSKSVIVATQMLDSMRDNPRPTRAEVSDVANAVIDHTDAVMLSDETAMGKYPVETVAMMAGIIRETEGSSYDDYPLPDMTHLDVPLDLVMSEMSRSLGEHVDAKAILVASLSGDTARLISRFRPEIPIIVTTNKERVRRQLALAWNVHPYFLKECRTVEELVDRSLVVIREEHVARIGDKIVVLAGEPVGQGGNVNLLEVKVLS